MRREKLKKRRRRRKRNGIKSTLNNCIKTKHRSILIIITTTIIGLKLLTILKKLQLWHLIKRRALLKLRPRVRKRKKLIQRLRRKNLKRLRGTLKCTEGMLHLNGGIMMMIVRVWTTEEATICHLIKKERIWNTLRERIKQIRKIHGSLEADKEETA